MKIVVIKSPKILSGILRVIFKIKKEEPTEQFKKNLKGFFNFEKALQSAFKPSLKASGFSNTYTKFE